VRNDIKLARDGCAAQNINLRRFVALGFPQVVDENESATRFQCQIP